MLFQKFVYEEPTPAKPAKAAKAEGEEDCTLAGLATLAGEYPAAEHFERAYLDASGEVVIPFGDSEAAWWNGGRSLILTAIQLGASFRTVKSYLSLERGDWLEDQAGNWISDGATQGEAEQAALGLLAEKEG